MSFRCRIERLFLALTFIAYTGPVAAAEPFVICAEPDNLPFSSQTAEGFEVQAAKIIANELKRPLEVRWVSQRTPDFLRVTIDAGACDALMSIPAAGGRLAKTQPWYRTSFMFVARSTAELPTGFDDSRLASLAVAVPMVAGGSGTPPAIILTRRSLVANLRPYSILASADMADDVSNGRVDLAVLWGPFAGWFAANQGKPLVLQPTSERDGQTPLAFDIAVGVRHGNDTLRAEIGQALERRKQDLQAVLDHWHIPTRRD